MLDCKNYWTVRSPIRLPLFTSALAKGFAASAGWLVATSAFGQIASADAIVRGALQAPTVGRINLIVTTSHPLSPKEEANLGRMGGYVYRHLSLIQSVAVNVPKRNLRRLLAWSPVRHVSADDMVRKTDAYTVGASYANVAWRQYGDYGTGVGVAVVDSGIHSDNDLGGGLFGSRIVASMNFSSDANTTDDLCGHGTHVAGIVSGNGSMSTGANDYQTFYGIAPHTNLVNVRVLDSHGAGSVSGVVEGISWAILNRFLYNIRIINLSVGHAVGESYTTDPLCSACEAAWKSGIVVVAAAGNDGRLNANPTGGAENSGYGVGYATVESPGNDPFVITVGAMKQTDASRSEDTIASYSSRGPSLFDFVVKPDLVAPGNQIISLAAPSSYLDTTFSSTNGVPYSAYETNAPSGISPSYFRMSGTSMAAPVVSGAAALMLQLDPLLSPDTIKARLMVSADKWANPDGTFDVFTYGAGYLDIPAAIQSNLFALPYAQDPTAEREPNGSVVMNLVNSLINGSLFGTGISDTRATWGNGTTNSSGTVASTRATWGNSFWSNNSTSTQATACVDLSEIALGGD